MSALADEILNLLDHSDGLTDREITDLLRGRAANQQPINAICRRLEALGRLTRRKRSDGLIGNFLAERRDPAVRAPDSKAAVIHAGRSRAEAAGDSPEQRAAEAQLIDGLARKLGVRLAKRKLQLPDGGRLELDGWSDTPPIACEAWAHIGPAKSAQKHKLMTDAFKLIFAAQFLPMETRKILVLADDEAARHLRGKGWMAQALNANDVKIEIIDLPSETLGSIRAAQKRQFR